MNKYDNELPLRGFERTDAGSDLVVRAGNVSFVSGFCGTCPQLFSAKG